MVSNDFTSETYPGGSGVKAKLLCDGEFSGVSICGYSSVHVLESILERQRIRLTETKADIQENVQVLGSHWWKKILKKKLLRKK